MADSEAKLSTGGILYQYYWIKVMDEGDVRDYRKAMLETAPHDAQLAKGVAQGEQPYTHTVMPPEFSTNATQGDQPNTYTVVKPGPQPYSIRLEGGAQPNTYTVVKPTHIQRVSLNVAREMEPDTATVVPVQPQRVWLSVTPENTGAKLPNQASMALMDLNIDLGFLHWTGYKKRKPMVLEVRAMDLGATREQVEAWIESPAGEKWAGDAFCTLAYIAIAPV